MKMIQIGRKRTDEGGQQMGLAAEQRSDWPDWHLVWNRILVATQTGGDSNILPFGIQI
jgi:hypothetical protein